MGKYLFLFLIISCLAGFLIFSFVLASEIEIKPSYTTEEGKSFLVKLFEAFPNAIKETCQKAISFWEKMYDKAKEIWDRFIQQRIEKILSFFKEQIIKRLSIFTSEFKKELKELKEEIFDFLKRILKKK